MWRIEGGSQLELYPAASSRRSRPCLQVPIPLTRASCSPGARGGSQAGLPSDPGRKSYHSVTLFKYVMPATPRPVGSLAAALYLANGRIQSPKQAVIQASCLFS
ncbi:hypothetical protein VTI28DRAFT_6161 [Corynascus sepedonium]